MNKTLKALAALSVLFISVMSFSFLIVSCDGSEDEENESMLRVSRAGGDNQSERVGAVLPQPLVVRVTGMTGGPSEGTPVFFTTGSLNAGIETPVAYTDSEGYASTGFRLGSEPGNQQVGVKIETDSTTFNLTADALGCTEEDPESACQWQTGHIYIVTTSSSMISGTGSVLISFDPDDGGTEEVLQTGLILHDIAFSSRGEMFLSTNDMVYKVDPGTKDLTPYMSLPVLTGCEIEPDMGGVLLMAGNVNVWNIGCQPGLAVQIADYTGLSYENLGVDPVSRDFYVASSGSTVYNIFHNEYDGRGNVTGSTRYEMTTGVGYMRGMCVDMEGFLYVTIDSNGNSRSVGRFKPGLSNEPKWFDFCNYYAGNNPASGRWGDITVLGDHLFLIDTYNNRLVILDATGTNEAERYITEYQSDVLSAPLSDSERYGIAAVPEWQVCIGPGS